MGHQLSLIYFLLLLFVSETTLTIEAASTKSIVDANINTLDLKHVAEQLICNKKNANSGKQLIGRISTIVKLADLFDDGSSLSIDKTCILENKDAIKDLKEILNKSNDNVCSDEKVSLIEEFHQKYTSTVDSDIVARKENNIHELTKPLKIFFIHYAMEISTICKKNLINNLEWDLKDKINENDYNLANGINLENIMFGIGKHFSAMNEVNSYDDIVMLWNIIDGSLLAKENVNTIGEHINKNSDELEIDNVTGEKIKLYVKSKNPTLIQSLQLKCFNKFKPIYEKLITPIIRLADLGYSYTSNEKFDKELKELKENPLVKRWYVITQICETVLPIKFIKDETLNGQETVMISSEEASKLLASSSDNSFNNDGEQRLQYEPTTNSMAGIDELTAMQSNESNQILQSIQSNLTARERAVRRAITRFAKSAFSFIKGKAGNIFSSKKKNTDNNGSIDAQYEKEDMHDILSKSLENVDEEKLLSMKGAFGHKRENKSKHHNEITRMTHRVRPIDIETARKADEEQISRMHTKSISGVLSGWWWFVAKSIAPSRLAIFLVGVGICLILIIIIFITATALAS